MGRRLQGRERHDLDQERRDERLSLWGGCTFEGKPGTNPEELIGAAHAGCFTMALALFLSEEGITAEHMDTQSDVELEKEGDGFAVKKVHLTLKAKIPGTDDAKFQEIAKKAKENCPISKLLTATITMDATLVG